MPTPLVDHCCPPLETTQEFCGDGLLGEGEQCDPGFGISTGADQCCNANTCKLLPGATCSDSNHVCCSGCMPASNGTVCQRADSLSCQADTLCKHPDLFQGHGGGGGEGAAGGGGEGQ